MPRVTLRYWASARAAAGTAEESFDAPSVAGALEAAQRTHGPRLAAVIGAASVLVDGLRTPKDDTAPLAEGAVLEILPPFAGG